MECVPQPTLFGIDFCGANDIGPFLNTCGDEVAEIGGAHRHRDATKVGKPRLDFGIGEARIDLLVELLDDLCRRILGCTEAVPVIRLVA